jgi:hypothetical protein
MFWYVIILLIIVILFICSKKKESFENIISVLNDSAGFYSQFFFTLNHYIYCKKNSKNFTINSDKWLFKSNVGWNDYFKPTELKFYKGTDDNYYSHNNTIEDYSISEYKENIPNIYIYNEKTEHEINKIKNKFQLIDKNYDSIFIRRGDKLIEESDYINENKYIELLLNKNPHCNKIFLQTDDYNCYLNLKDYIKNNNLNIEIYTLCDKNMVGVVVKDDQKELLKNTTKNSEYLNKIRDDLNKTKSVEKMNSDEKYKHVIDMIVGIDLVCNSNICITDYQSNVSRFIKLYHTNPENVYDIDNTQIDYNKKICPAYSF